MLTIKISYHIMKHLDTFLNISFTLVKTEAAKMKAGRKSCLSAFMGCKGAQDNATFIMTKCRDPVPMLRKKLTLLHKALDGAIKAKSALNILNAAPTNMTNSTNSNSTGRWRHKREVVVTSVTIIKTVTTFSSTLVTNVLDTSIQSMALSLLFWAKNSLTLSFTIVQKTVITKTLVVVEQAITTIQTEITSTIASIEALTGTKESIVVPTIASDGSGIGAATSGVKNLKVLVMNKDALEKSVASITSVSSQTESKGVITGAVFIGVINEMIELLKETDILTSQNGKIIILARTIMTYSKITVKLKSTEVTELTTLKTSIETSITTITTQITEKQETLKSQTGTTASTSSIGAEEINADGSGSETVEERKKSTLKLIKMSAHSEAITSSKTALDSLVSSSDSSTESEGSITSTVLVSQITILKETADASFEEKILTKIAVLITEMIKKLVILTKEEKTSVSTMVSEKVSVVLESLKTMITEEESTLKEIVEKVSTSGVSSAKNMDTIIIFEMFSTEFTKEITEQIELTETIIKSSINLAATKFLVTSSGTLTSNAVDLSSLKSISLKATITSEFMVVYYEKLGTAFKSDSTSSVVMQISLLLLKMAKFTISKFSATSTTSLTKATTEIKTEQTSLETTISKAEASLSKLTGKTESASSFGIAEVKEDGSGNSKVEEIASIVVSIVVYEVNLKITEELKTSITALKSSDSSSGDISCADFSAKIKEILDKLEASKDDDSVINLSLALFKETSIKSCSSEEKTTLETFETTITTISTSITTEITKLVASFKKETTLEAVTKDWNLISLIGKSNIESTEGKTTKAAEADVPDISDDGSNDDGASGDESGTDDTGGTGGDTGGTGGTGGSAGDGDSGQGNWKAYVDVTNALIPKFPLWGVKMSKCLGNHNFRGRRIQQGLPPKKIVLREKEQ